MSEKQNKKEQPEKDNKNEIKYDDEEIELEKLDNLFENSENE